MVMMTLRAMNVFWLVAVAPCLVASFSIEVSQLPILTTTTFHASFPYHSNQPAVATKSHSDRLHRRCSQDSRSSSTTARWAGELDTVVSTASTVASSVTSSGALTKLAGGAIDSFFQTNPYLSAFLTCSVKASAADLVAQQSQTEDDAENNVNDERAKICLQRNLAFIVYGGVYQGLFQELLYSVLFPQWFGTDTSFLNVAKQVALDMLFVTPFVCLPIAYVVKAAFTADELSIESMQNSLQKYIQDVSERGLLLRYWSIWIPAQSLTFSVIPQHFRVAFVAVISFFWVFILSSISSATGNNDDTCPIEDCSSVTATATIEKDPNNNGPALLNEMSMNSKDA